jgi:hypothetical protein
LRRRFLSDSHRSRIDGVFGLCDHGRRANEQAEQGQSLGEHEVTSLVVSLRIKEFERQLLGSEERGRDFKYPDDRQWTII